MQTQNNIVYGELGRVILRNHLLVSVICYWFKVIQCDDAKYIKLTYNMMLNDFKKSSQVILGQICKVINRQFGVLACMDISGGMEY